LSTFQWLLGLITIFTSCWCILPLLFFIAWLAFAVRIIRRHHLTLEDMLLREKDREA